MKLLLTLSIPTAAYLLGYHLGVSAPLAMVVSGIILGNWTRSTSFNNENMDEYLLDHFWGLVDEFLMGFYFY